MSTQSMIGIEQPNGSVLGVYCHWDGYLSHVGRILNAHYTTREQVSALLAGGDISSLGEQIGQKHNFYDSSKGVTTYYHRDRGEELRVKPFKTRAEFRLEDYEYLYLFTDAGWLVKFDNDFVPLADALATDLEGK